MALLLLAAYCHYLNCFHHPIKQRKEEEGEKTTKSNRDKLKIYMLD